MENLHARIYRSVSFIFLIYCVHWGQSFIGISQRQWNFHCPHPYLTHRSQFLIEKKNRIWLWVKRHFWGRNELFLFTLQTHYFKLRLQIWLHPWCFKVWLKYILQKVQDGSTFRLSHFYIYFSNFVLRSFWEIHWFLVKICHWSLTLSDGQKWVSFDYSKTNGLEIEHI